MTFPCRLGYTGLFLGTYDQAGIFGGSFGEAYTIWRETLELVAQFPNIMVTEEVAPPTTEPNGWTCG